MAAKGKEKKGLGTGLDILFGGDDFAESEAEVLTLPISKVEPRKEQPREYFDQEKLEELSRSISEYGVIQPIVVRKLDSGYYQIIAGERRWRASRMAGLKEVPVRVIEADDKTTAKLALVENLQREDLNPIEEAKGYKALIEDYGLTQEEAAKSVGCSRPAITNSLRLLNLGTEIQALVEKGTISAGHARALLPLTSEKMQMMAAQEVIRSGLSVRKTELLAAKLARKPGEPLISVDGRVLEVKVDYAAEIGGKLSSILGRKVTLVDGRRVGRIEIEFYGSDDRERLIEMLKQIKRP